MITQDFSGVYDYEKEEAEFVATALLEDLRSGYYRDKNEFDAAVKKELSHWEHVLSDLPGSFLDFERHFNFYITEGAKK